MAHENLTERQMRDEGYRETAAGDPLAGRAAAEVMSSGIVALDASLTLAEAGARVAGSRHRFYPVVNEQRKLIGLLPSQAMAEATDHPLASPVQPWPVVARTTDDVRDLIRRLAKEGVDRCPVTDEEGRVVGFVSPADVLRVRMATLE